MPARDPRGSFNLVPGELHDIRHWTTIRPHNLILRDPPPQWRWVAAASEQLAEWRGLLRSTYIQWCLVINGLYLADKTYRGESWQQPGRRFTVEGIRAGEGGRPVAERFAEWDGATAAAHHLATVPKTVAWALVDMFSTFEDFVLAMYRAYFAQYPETLLRVRGTGGRRAPDVDARLAERRERWNAAQAGDRAAAEAWQDDLTQLFGDWRAVRARDPLPTLLRGFFELTRLPVPPGYRAGPDEWVKPLRYLNAMRNALVHGDKTVTAALAAAAAKAGIELTEGEQIVVDVIHLQAFEQYVDQLLTAVNRAMAEAVVGPLMRADRSTPPRD